MVGEGEQPPEKTTEEIAREDEEEITRTTHLAREARIGKRCNGLQDNSGSLDDEPRDGAPSRPITVNLRGNRPDQVPGREGLPHAGSQCFGLKNAH
jgi:hypothetical protein